MSRARSVVAVSLSVAVLMIAWLAWQTPAAPSRPRAAHLTYPVTLHIPVAVDPDERRERYEAPLQERLSELGWGVVVGGTQAVDGDGDEACDVSVNLDRSERLPALVALLAELGLPEGSTLFHLGDDVEL